MTNFEEYVKPELMSVAVVLYIIGLMLKNTEKIKDKYIPGVLGIIGILICSVYVLSVEGISGMGVFTAITQGIICAGIAVYVNQIIKQSTK